MSRIPAALLLTLHLPEAVCVNQDLAVLTVDGQTIWFHCLLPVGAHDADDRRALRRRLGEFAHLGTATPAELARACGLSPRTVYRARKLWAEQGERGFHQPRQPRPRTAVSDAIGKIAEQALAMGRSLRAAAREAGLHVETLRQNILAGVVQRPAPDADSAPSASAPAAEAPAVETEPTVAPPAPQPAAEPQPQATQSAAQVTATEPLVTASQERGHRVPGGGHRVGAARDGARSAGSGRSARSRDARHGGPRGG